VSAWAALFSLGESEVCGDFSEAEKIFSRSGVIGTFWRLYVAASSHDCSSLLAIDISAVANAKLGQPYVAYDLGAWEPNVAVFSSQSVLPPNVWAHDSNWRRATRLVRHHLRAFLSNHTLVGSCSIGEVARVEGPLRSLVGRSWIVSAAITCPVIPTKSRLQLLGSR
jgi:hypothetical protein